MTAKNFLPKGFEPGPNDVIIGRGKQSYNHQGNLKLRKTVASRLEEYSATTTKKAKSQIICSIIDHIRTSQPAGSFLKHDRDYGYYDVGNFLSSDKISQTFRDLLRGNYKSSNAYKKNRRKNLKRQMLDTVQPSPPQAKKIDQFPIDQSIVNMSLNRNLDLLSFMNNGGGQKLFKRPRFEARRSNMPIELNQAIESFQSTQEERVDKQFCQQDQSPTLFSLALNKTLSSQPVLNKEEVNAFKSIAFRRTSLGSNPLHGLCHIATNGTMILDSNKSTVVSSDESGSDSGTDDIGDSSCEEFESDSNFNSSKEDQWVINLEQLENFYKKNGFDSAPLQSNCTSHVKLTRWIEEQSKDYLNFYEGRRTSMTAMQIVRLEKVGFSKYLRKD